MSSRSLGRAGRIETAHGFIATPAFVPVATQASLKGLPPDLAAAAGAPAIFANTFHLHLEPGEAVIKQAGGLHKFMNWPGPIFTDSGGFQVFSLGAGYDRKLSKIAVQPEQNFRRFTHQMGSDTDENFARVSPLVKIDDDGVTFRSPRDGRELRLTPEKSIQIQHDLGADIILAFDECVSPESSYESERRALERIHLWAERSLAEHRRLSMTPRVTLKETPRVTLARPVLFGIVQGGRFQDLRAASAKTIGAMDFDGFGIGGSFSKADIEATAVLVNQILPAGKPRHLLGIGAVEDIFAGAAAGCDTFDCVTPTRLARHGALETARGRLNILQARFRDDFLPVEKDCQCYTCVNYTRAYLAHLFRAREMLGLTLAAVHNLYFFNHLMGKIRTAILDGNLAGYQETFVKNYRGVRLRP